MPLHFQSPLPEHVRSAIKERNRAKNEIAKVPPQSRPLQIKKFKAMRNRVVSLLRTERYNNVDKSLKKGKHPWKVANEVLGRVTKNSDIKLVEDGRELGSDEERANLLNVFFVDKIKALKEKINPDIKTDPLSKMTRTTSKFSFKEVSVRDTLRTISAMKVSKCSGLDGITSEVLKQARTEIAPVLTTLINTALTEGNFPRAFKCAVITPIFKNKGKQTDKANYRPISGLPVLGKCMECLVEAQLRRYFETHKLLGHNQHGF